MIAADHHHNEHENISEGQTMNLYCIYGVNIQHKSKGLQEAKFHCPMNCEGDKSYNRPGECPACNMQLIMVGQDEPRNRIE